MRKTAGCAVAILGLLAGCSWQSGVMTGAHMGANAARQDLHVKVFLDDHEASQNTAKKAATGYARWKIGDHVGTSPKLKFIIEKPDKFGRITMVSVAIHQEFKGDYSNQAEYTVVSKSQDPEAQLKPDTVYDFGAMPEGFKISNLTGQEVPKVE